MHLFVLLHTSDLQLNAVCHFEFLFKQILTNQLEIHYTSGIIYLRKRKLNCKAFVVSSKMFFDFRRARVKGGMRILGATASSDEWNVSVEKENTKHTVARVTAFRKDQDPDSTSRQQDDSNGNK